jgi:hypothetical protein
MATGLGFVWMDPRDTTGHVHLLPPQEGHVALSQARRKRELRHVTQMGWQLIQ